MRETQKGTMKARDRPTGKNMVVNTENNLINREQCHVVYHPSANESTELYQIICMSHSQMRVFVIQCECYPDDQLVCNLLNPTCMCVCWCVSVCVQCRAQEIKIMSM